MLLTTPNPYYPPYAVFELLLSKRKYYYNDTHINLFPPRIMEKLLKSSGFECIKIMGTGNFSFILPRTLRQQIIYVAKKVRKTDWSQHAKNEQTKSLERR